MQVIRRLGMSTPQVEEQFRRMAFNIVARNQDDHVKNIAFLMSRRGVWSLAPAYDVTYSYNPYGRWTSSHQMSMNGRRDGFTREDFRECARAVSLKRGRADVDPRRGRRRGAPVAPLRRVRAGHAPSGAPPSPRRTAWTSAREIDHRVIVSSVTAERARGFRGRDGHEGPSLTKET